jgi:hypothetical protein
MLSQVKDSGPEPAFSRCLARATKRVQYRNIPENIGGIGKTSVVIRNRIV